MLFRSNLHYQGSLVKDSYRGVKENIHEADDALVEKLLEIPVRTFDYRPGFGDGKNGVPGFIVDEVEGIFPDAIIYPDDWNEEEFNELRGSVGNEKVPGIDYTYFIPLIIGMQQQNQKRMAEMEQEIAELKAKLS